MLAANVDIENGNVKRSGLRESHSFRHIRRHSKNDVPQFFEHIRDHQDYQRFVLKDEESSHMNAFSNPPAQDLRFRFTGTKGVKIARAVF